MRVTGEVLPDGTVVAADEEEQKAREAKRLQQEKLEAEAKAKREAAEEEHKRKHAEAEALAEKQAAERKKAGKRRPERQRTFFQGTGGRACHEGFAAVSAVFPKVFPKERCHKVSDSH